MDGCTLSVRSRLGALTLLCCAGWLMYADRALAQDTSAPPTGTAVAGDRAPAPASATATGTSDTSGAAANAASVPSFGYRVAGRSFVIEATVGQPAVLSTTQLPWPGREPPLILGKAAYVVLPESGLAVIDIGLARFPYIVWRLSPDVAVRSISLENQTLRVTTWHGTVQYDVRDPLRPRGPDTFAADPRRDYGENPAATGTEDQHWDEQGARWAQKGRRVYLSDGRVVLGRFRGLDLARNELTLEVLGQTRALPTSRIVHVDPVFFGEVGTGMRPLAASPASRKGSSALAVLVGVPMVIAYSAVVVTAATIYIAILVCGLPVPYVGSTGRC